MILSTFTACLGSIAFWVHSKQLARRPTKSITFAGRLVSPACAGAQAASQTVVATAMHEREYPTSLKRGAFKSIVDLQTAISRYVVSRPFF
ncbi:hypothetical protein [Mesorhizobium sp. B2-6-5]|uniref:hypothetical protein n=1 Tax=Mesorhizobium sp. B2-6-5 TaxID=2589912 RepID=UPI00112649F6|nr:hypothetical protein [Mesorhizobium sp. B2-6-5]TPJ43435.1 hypothetical protein FJ432_05785 [Mesorhizobium sp. B2-6-5]